MLANSTFKAQIAKTIIFLVATSIFATGCALKDRSPYIIGLLVPLTGNGHAAGAAHLGSVKHMAAEINKSGGIDGRMIKLEVEDTAGDDVQTLIAIKRLLEIQYAYAVLYPYQSGFSDVVPRSFNLAKTPVIIYGAQPDIPKKQTNIWTIIVRDDSRLPTQSASESNLSDSNIVDVSDKNLKKVFSLLTDGIKMAGLDKSRARRYMRDALSAENK